MSQNEKDSDTKTTDSESSGFLGGGPKFNQAGLNTPMPGEKTSDVPPPPFFGGPRVWTAVLVIIVLIAFAWFSFGDKIAGTTSTAGVHGGIDENSRPDVNSDQGQ